MNPLNPIVYDHNLMQLIRNCPKAGNIPDVVLMNHDSCNNFDKPEFYFG